MEDSVDESESFSNLKARDLKAAELESGSPEQENGTIISISNQKGEEQVGGEKQAGEINGADDGGGDQETEVTKISKDEAHRGGGLIDQLISSLPSLPIPIPIPAEEDQSDDKETEAAKTSEDEADGGGGIIDQIISNLPSLPLPIPDDTVPEADEASLLISIIHD